MAEVSILKPTDQLWPCTRGGSLKITASPSVTALPFRSHMLLKKQQRRTERIHDIFLSPFLALCAPRTAFSWTVNGSSGAQCHEKASHLVRTTSTSCAWMCTQLISPGCWLQWVKNESNLKQTPFTFTRRELTQTLLLHSNRQLPQMENMKVRINNVDGFKFLFWNFSCLSCFVLWHNLQWSHCSSPEIRVTQQWLKHSATLLMTKC